MASNAENVSIWWHHHGMASYRDIVDISYWYISVIFHDDVIKWKHFPRYWPFVRRIHRFPVNSPHKGQWRGALMFTLICARINGWVNNREAGDLRRHRTHYDVIVMFINLLTQKHRHNQNPFRCSQHQSLLLFCQSGLKSKHSTWWYQDDPHVW